VVLGQRRVFLVEFPRIAADGGTPIAPETWLEATRCEGCGLADHPIHSIKSVRDGGPPTRSTIADRVTGSAQVDGLGRIQRADTFDTTVTIGPDNSEGSGYVAVDPRSPHVYIAPQSRGAVTVICPV
jgi:hypothetical protein